MMNAAHHLRSGRERPGGLLPAVTFVLVALLMLAVLAGHAPAGASHAPDSARTLSPQVRMVLAGAGIVTPAGDTSGAGCVGQAERCGARVRITDALRGVDNCASDLNCRTRRIVDNTDPGRGSDFVPVPDAVTADGSASCTPREPGHLDAPLDAVVLPTGRVGVNPRHEQLTGLDSWYWWEGPAVVTWTGPVYVGVTADCAVLPAPPPRRHRARLVELRWHVEDGRPEHHRAARRGSEDDPAITHTYETKGTWRTTVSCVWQADSGERAEVACGSRQVDVIEVRTRLAGP